MSKGYEVVSLRDIEPVPYHSREGQLLIGVERRLGYRAAGINGWTGNAGDLLVPRHREDDEEELYVVVHGRATFTVEGKTIDAPAGTLIHLQHHEEREARAEEAGTLVVAIGGTPGQAHRPSGWTDFVTADALRRQGRTDEGRAAIEKMLDAFPDAWHAPYNAACYEALAGDADAAFAHLCEAVRRDPQNTRELASHDDDLAGLRADPRWREAIG